MRRVGSYVIAQKLFGVVRREMDCLESVMFVVLLVELCSVFGVYEVVA